MTFTEHDLRAKSLSDEKEIAIAIQRGDHSTGNTTSRVYRRKAEKVLPLSLAEIGLGELMDDARCDMHVAEFYLRQYL